MRERVTEGNADQKRIFTGTQHSLMQTIFRIWRKVKKGKERKRMKDREREEKRTKGKRNTRKEMSIKMEHPLTHNNRNTDKYTSLTRTTPTKNLTITSKPRVAS